jgi:hypothetical protein
MKKVFLVIAVLVLASLACNAVSDIGNPTPAQQQNPSGQILYQDDFSNVDSGWPVKADANKAASYGDGQYLIQAFTANQDVWAHPGESFGDVQIEVDTTKANGPDDNSFGILCRFVDDDNFYFFIISSDGYQAIGKYMAGEFSYLTSDKMQPSSAINTGGAANHVRADCVGSTLTLYVNGEQVSSTTDASFTAGDVGLIVGTFNEPNAGILFDNLVIYKP